MIHVEPNRPKYFMAVGERTSQLSLTEHSRFRMSFGMLSVRRMLANAAGMMPPHGTHMQVLEMLFFDARSGFELDNSREPYAS